MTDALEPGTQVVVWSNFSGHMFDGVVVLDDGGDSILLDLRRPGGATHGRELIFRELVYSR